ncbi:cytochrome P450 [Paraburkholderia hospita]|uniref:Cytochrome P450 n=2 Tax=Paraburkholderia hospita TaxID=169430 RepID=A0ABP2PSM4_9BURK|nr:cytochrome P450 [Paraburkholderia hospita]OUL88225.1 cytochrome P450 [Paraburkholderia hospita]
MRIASKGSERRRELIELQRLFSRAMLFVDKPGHPRLRRAMQAGFRPDSIETLKPFVSATIEELLDDIEASACREPFDFISRFARVLPARVIAKLLGLSHVDQAEFLAWSTDLASFIGAGRPTEDETERALQSIVSMGMYFDSVICGGRYSEDEGLLGVLVKAQESGEIQKGPEMLAQCAMLLFAGHETTRHLLGTAVYWLLRHRGSWEALKSDRSVVKNAVRELLRWDSPVQYTGRRANCDFILHGMHIRRGDLVLPLIGAANRDPSRYSDPDELQLDRQVGMPLSFGSGPHVCIGATLTLMEVEAAVAALLRRWPDLQIAQRPDDWIASPLYRGLVSLPLSFDSDARQNIHQSDLLVEMGEQG